MSNTARKIRKAAGIRFTHPTKVGTPLAERAVPFTWKRRNGGMVESVGTRAMQRKRRRATVTGEAI